VKRLLADAMLDNTKKGDARCPFPLGYRSRLEYTPRAHFNGVNSKRVYDAVSATLTSPRQRKRFDRTGDRAAHRIPGRNQAAFCCQAAALIRQ